LDQSLSLVLPVHNAQSILARQVTTLLDLLPELTTRFEVLIVDDGSTDRTEEEAHELAVRYPQVKVARHNRRQGKWAALETGIRHARGELVILQDDESISPAQLRWLWAQRHDRRIWGKQANQQVSLERA
jgi:glycosyltransferase involved in cell wall biosynthesis